MPDNVHAAIRIHLQTVGAVTMDIIENLENDNSPCVIDTMDIPTTTPVLLHRPSISNTILMGVLVIPPTNNVYEYNFGPNPLQLGIRFHPSFPSFIALGSSQDAIYMNHVAPGTLKFTFVWI